MSPDERQLLQEIWKQVVATDRTLNTRMDQLETRGDKLETRLDTRIDKFEGRLDDFIAWTKAMFRHLAGLIGETNVRVDLVIERVEKLEPKNDPT